MQRACAAALVRNGISVIHNPGISNDDKAALNIIESLGAEVTINNEQLVINSNGITPVTAPSGNTGVIHCGESGLSIRMFTPIAALSENEITINGEGSLLNRPINFFDEVLPQLGVQVHSNAGKLPLQIKGPLQPKNITIDGSLSSQFLTGLLFAYSVATSNSSKGGEFRIAVSNLKSKPYIDLTLDVMKHFGLLVPENRNYEEFVFNYDASKVPPSEEFREVVNYTVEGDWSGAAFLLVAGAIAGNITLKGLDIHSTQADKKIIEALKDCGCKLTINDSEISIVPPSDGFREAFNFDATDCPDLFPPLTVLAAYCNGTSIIKGVSRLAHKESNRAITLKEEFAKFGIEITLDDDVMKVNGGRNLKGAMVSSHHDHRIAMACAIAALKANDKTIIENAEAINKSYPNFYEHLKALGVSIN